MQYYPAECIFITLCRTYKTQSSYRFIPMSTFRTGMSIAWRWVILSTCNVCSISLIMLALHFTLTIQGLFIDTDNRFKKRRVGQHVSEHVREKRNSLQIQPTIQTQISGVAGIRFVLEVMNNCKFSCTPK